MKTIFILTACALACAPSAGNAAQRPAPLPQKLDAYVRSFALSGLFSGVVLVKKDGKILYQKAYGMAERSFGVPLTVDTKFQIASLSKSVTAAAVGRLVDQGKLDFDAPVARYLAGIPNGDRITIDQLLTHFSGLESPDREAGSESWMRFPQTTGQLVERVKALPPAFKPGEKYYYSNGNYWILAHLIETVSGLPYGEFLRREIFQPLGMNNSGHRGDLLLIVPKLAGGYAPEGLTTYRQADLVDWTSKTGNGSLYSTAADMTLFYEALKSGKLLKAATTQREFGFGKPVGYGWGHREPPKAERRSIYFNGRSPGYTAFLEGYLDNDVSFVILSNLYVYAPTIMAEGVAAILWNKPYQLQQPIKVTPVRAESLTPWAGNYQFGPKFFLKNGRAEIVPRGDHMIMRWSSGGVVSTLLPLGNDSFFDPSFWATLKFEKNGEERIIKYKAHGFDEEHLAHRLGASKP